MQVLAPHFPLLFQLPGLLKHLIFLLAELNWRPLFPAEEEVRIPHLSVVGPGFHYRWDVSLLVASGAAFVAYGFLLRRGV